MLSPAGTIGSGTYGVAKSVNLVGVKVLSNAGTGLNSAVIAGVEWVLEQALKEKDRPKICNLSLTGGFLSPALNKYVSALVTEGLVFTAVAAGNDNRTACLSSPANAFGVMSVGATDRNDQRSSFSNFGRCVDIFGELSFSPTCFHLLK
jgi:subtilisin family serine protease